MGDRNEYLREWGAGGGVPDRLLHERSFLPCVLFITASTLAFYGANPFCFLVTVLQFMHMIYPLSALSNVCMSL